MLSMGNCRKPQCTVKPFFEHFIQISQHVYDNQMIHTHILTSLHYPYNKTDIVPHDIK